MDQSEILKSLFLETEKGTVFTVILTPNARKSDVLGVFEDEKNNIFLRVSVTSSPINNKANQHLIELLSKKLKIAKSDLQIIKGQKLKRKKILIKKNICLLLTEKSNLWWE